MMAGHINNLYNTTFWTLVLHGGMNNQEAEKALAVCKSFQNLGLHANQRHQGSVSADKNEILFSRFGINYNNEPEIYKKGSVIFRDVGRSLVVDGREGWTPLTCIQYELVEPGTHNIAQEIDDLGEPIEQSKTQAEREKKKRTKARVVIEHLDVIKDEFWNERPWILSNKPGKIPKEV